MKFVELKSVCGINMGQSPDSSSCNDEGRGIPFFQGNADFGERYPVTRVWCDSPTKVAKANDILVSVRAPIGALNYAKEKCCIGRGLAALTPDSRKVSPEYVYWLLKSKNAELNDKGTGSTFKAINRKVLEEVLVPDIGLDQQVACADKLEAIRRIIQCRQQQLSALDDLIKSRFVEMFGTFPDNPHKWETGTIRNVIADVRYGSSRPAVDGGRYPYLRMNNITYNGELDLSDTKRIDIPENELEKCTVQRGDVLFNRTNSKELVGKTCVYNRDEQMVLAGFVIRVRLNNKMLPEFLSSFLNTDFSKKMLLGMCKTAIGQANINAQEMQGIGIYIPPIELQNEFVSFKEQLDKSKVAIQQSLATTRTLFDSLMQKFFG